MNERKPIFVTLGLYTSDRQANRKPASQTDRQAGT